MLAIEILKKDENLGGDDTLPGFEEEHTCAVTGKQTSSHVPLKTLYKEEPPFNLLQAPSSQYIDSEIAEILKDGHLRWNSWVIDNTGFRTIKKNEARNILQNPPPPPWGMYCAQDMRRHGGLITFANQNNTDYIVSLGGMSCKGKKAISIYPEIEAMYLKGVGRDNLLTLTPHQANFKEITHAEWYGFAKKYESIKNTPEYRLAVWLLPTKDEMKEVEEGGETNGTV